MHGSFDRSREAEKTSHLGWDIGFFALSVVLATVLIVLAFTQPGASNLISEAAQAEFASAYSVPKIAPTRIAQPKETGSIGAN